MLEARKRTAIDGKILWCVFDTKDAKWSTLTCFGRYRLKKDCQIAIDYYTNKYREICKEIEEEHKKQ